MKIRMQLLSDAVFGNGESVPGGEDISILCDEEGFPYYKGGTFKGVFREALEQYLLWTIPNGDGKVEKIRMETERLLGKGGNHQLYEPDKIVFSDFQISDYVKGHVLSEIGAGAPDSSEQVKDAFSHLRTFTKITEDGIAAEGSLRSCRCINRGLNFYSEVSCSQKDETMLMEVLSGIKWIGTMRNRGFGQVKITTAG